MIKKKYCFLPLDTVFFVDDALLSSCAISICIIFVSLKFGSIFLIFLFLVDGDGDDVKDKGDGGVDGKLLFFSFF